jgi:hypothetical protein
MAELATEPFYPDRDDREGWLDVAVEIALIAMDVGGEDLRGAAIMGHSGILFLYRHAYPTDPEDLLLLFKETENRQKLLQDTSNFMQWEWDLSPDTVLAELDEMVEAGDFDEPSPGGHA